MRPPTDEFDHDLEGSEDQTRVDHQDCLGEGVRRNEAAKAAVDAIPEYYAPSLRDHVMGSRSARWARRIHILHEATLCFPVQRSRALEQR
jgi:hypothetical protein